MAIILTFKTKQIMNEENKNMLMLLHCIGTAQILLDEIGRMQNKQISKQINYYKFEVKKHTEDYVRKMKATGKVLDSIWDKIPNDEFSAYLDAKNSLIDRILSSTHEDIVELDQQLKDVHHKYRLFDVFEKVLNTHCIPTMRDAYRKELGYNLEQYNELKRMQELGYVPNYEQSKTA